ncbi:MAG: CPBP family intramembrane metalloprotease [Vicingaceae bacterium]|nr:CPBP family intramembrane metalloprotease [Vicingaceae bacterium]
MGSKHILLIAELFILFIITPILLSLDIHPIFKILPVLLGLIYCITITIKQSIVSAKEMYAINLKRSWKPITLQFITFVIVSIILMYYLNYENLFIVLRKNWIMWITITLFYSIFSVYPQEFLYRTFFFKRYSVLFKNTTVLIIFNAAIFSLAHLAFNNLLVSTLTFIGGILFAFTYHKSKSLLLTSIEHALYGSWLFTLGMGEMLAFPMPS